MSELRPCPFCPDGGKPDVSQTFSFASSVTPEFFITCLRCGVQSSTYVDAEHAIEAWNQRAEPAYLAGYKDGYQIGKSEVRTCKLGTNVMGVSRCSECRSFVGEKDKYCPHCGAKVVE